jgi:hypothetical protein
MKNLTILLLSMTLFGCGQSSEDKHIDNQLEMKQTNLDSGFTVISTTKFITASATKKFSLKNRKATQFALDIKSRVEKSENFKIKISEKKIIISDLKDSVYKELFVIKQWTDKSGPSTVFDLKDKNGIEYSLDHYVDYNNKNYLGLRHEKSLETYTNE